jgi:hypothetical protein
MLRWFSFASVCAAVAAWSCGGSETGATSEGSSTGGSGGATDGAGGTSAGGATSAGGGSTTSTTGGGGSPSCTDQCPTDLPDEGTPCTGDVSCAYGVRSCTCNQGAWQCFCCSMANCPGTAPTPGTACGTYMGTAGCGYGDHYCSCPSGVWVCEC